MTKELTDKVKKEIIASQVKELEDSDPSNFMNYQKIKEALMKGLDNYSSYSKDLINQKIDGNLLESLDESGFQSERVINGVKEYQSYFGYSGISTNKEVLKAYKDKKDFMKVRGVGKKTTELLEKYLVEKGLI